MIVHSKNLKEINENPYMTEDGRLKVGENIVDRESLPQIPYNACVHVHYLNFANLLYVTATNDRTHINKSFILEQELIEGKIKIKNIYSTIEVEESNELHKFFNFNSEYIKDVLKRNIVTYLCCLDYAINLDNLQEQIEQHLEKQDKPIIPKTDISINFQNKSLQKIAKEVGISYGTLWSRTRVKGMSLEEAIKLGVEQKYSKNKKKVAKNAKS